MQPLPPLVDWLLMEHQVAQILIDQERHGFHFDERSAWELAQTLQSEYGEAADLLRDQFPVVAGQVHNPPRSNKTKGWHQGAPFTRLKETNPSSRDHLAWILTNRCGVTLSQMTGTGKPMIDETVLTDIGTETALLMLKCLTLTKQLGFLQRGVNAWLKLSTSANRIHHHCSVEAATGRCTHKKPNLSQVPSEERFRKLFTATPGLVMCGADLAGIELRVLAHYLARYDGGKYAEVLLHGDIHQQNADAIGVSRKQVKTITYAMIYGASDTRLGHAYDPALPDKKAAAKGKEIRAAYISAIPGFGDLLSAVSQAAGRGFVKAIDGRKIPIKSPHSCLNFLLQGSAACIAKRWMVIANTALKDKANQLAFVHDELQYETHSFNVDDVLSTLESTATQAGEYYNLRIPIAAEAKSGDNWSEVH